MKILYLFANYDSMMFQWQKYHIFDEMAEHDCIFDVISPSSFERIEQLNDKIITKIKANHYDIFFTSYNEDVIWLSTIEEIKRYGVPTVLFCPDNLVDPFRHKNVASKFDLVWLTSKETEYMFKRWGANTIFLPYAANPNFLKGDIPREDIPRVGFIGTPHGSRVANINKLLESGIPLTVHSKKNDTSNAVFRASGKDYISVMKDYIKYPIGRKLLCGAIVDKLGKNEVDLYNPNLVLKDPVPLNKLANANSSFALTLSFTSANSTGVLKHPVNIVNLRNFEIPMSGGLQFCRYTDEIASYFEPDKEIVLFHNNDEMIDKAKFYLSEENSELRMKMKIAARKRAEKDHTWYKRFSALFKKMNLSHEL